MGTLRKKKSSGFPELYRIARL